MKKTRNSEAVWNDAQQRWCIRVQQDGIRKAFYSSKAGKKGKIEAERKADEWLERGDIKELRFDVAYDKFIEDKRRECGTAWVNKLESQGRIWMKPSLEHKIVSKITQQDWKNVMLAAYEKGRSKKTLENIRGTITSFATWCEDNKIEIAPIRSLKIPTDAPVGERKIVQPTGIKVLMEKDTIAKYGRLYRCWYIHAWRLFVVLGLRRGELCGLRQEDIKDGVLNVRRSINGFNEETLGKTKAAQRSMVIPAHAQAILDAQAAMLKEAGVISPWVFPDETGGQSEPNRVYRLWQTFRKQYGIKSSIHELRHTHISLMKNTVPVNMLKRMVGHTPTMDTFGVYGHEVDGEAQKTAALVDDVLDNLL